MVRIPLRNRKGEVRAYALVDDDMAHIAEGCRWSLHSGGYAYRMPNRGVVFMHRLILGLEPGDGLQGDHINGNRLDNRRANLRALTIQQQRQNVVKSDKRFRGIFLDKRRGLYYGQVQIAYKKHGTGYFETPEEANDAVIKLRAQLHSHANELRHTC